MSKLPWLILGFSLLLILAADPVSARERPDKRVVDGGRFFDRIMNSRLVSGIGKVLGFFAKPVVAVGRFLGKTFDDIFGRNKKGWQDGYYFKVPPKFKSMTVKEFEKLNGAKTSTRGEYMRLRESRGRASTPVLLQVEEEPDSSGCWTRPQYHFFDNYPSCQRSIPGDQGDCASCWAYATTTSLTHRLCKAVVDAGYPAPPNVEESRLSPQKMLSCKDGGPCNGEEVLLAHLLIEEDFVEPMAAAPYDYMFLERNRGEAECQKLKNSNGRIRVSGDFAFMLTGERQMKEAICTGGPITAIMETSPYFVGASGEGVFSSNSSNTVYTDLGNHIWHAVSISGWGVHNGTDYWVVENSWGPIYNGTSKMIANHNSGFVLVHRGSDEMKLESTPSFAQEPLLRVGRERVSVSEGWPYAISDMSQECFLEKMNERKMNRGPPLRLGEYPCPGSVVSKGGGPYRSVRSPRMSRSAMLSEDSQLFADSSDRRLEDAPEREMEIVIREAKRAIQEAKEYVADVANVQK